VNLATFAGSKPSEIFSVTRGFFKIVLQLKPACAPSKIKNSNAYGRHAQAHPILHHGIEYIAQTLSTRGI